MVWFVVFMAILTLADKAMAVALVMGVFFLVLGGNLGPFFLLAMLYFLFLSAIVTKIGHSYKVRAKLYEKQRGIKNVLANGGWPLFMVVVYFLMRGSAFQSLAVVGFLSALAAVMADKFSSEIGVLDGIPISIIGFRKVDKGVSGGVTWVGLLAGLLGSALIAALLLFLGSFIAVTPYIFLAVVVGGFGGTLFDSVLGWFEEKGIGNKFTSNFFGSVFGSLISIIVVLL